MRRGQPKKYISKVSFNKKRVGNEQRVTYQNVILENQLSLPQPLEYEDVDQAFMDFVDEKIDIEVDGKLIPTFTLMSNQRFSEYTQTWEHTDEYGNLYLNFKTVNRDKDPKFGGNQANYYKIPGNRRYTILKRDVLDDNGTESVEIYSMSQPITVDLTYSVTFVGTTLEKVNEFNLKLNTLFASKQYYIRPNGHFIPMVIDDINDATSYAIDERKFYKQTVTIKVMAYFIPRDSLEVRRYPKKINVSVTGDVRKKATVDIEEYDNSVKNKSMGLSISFDDYITTAEFDIDCDMDIIDVEKTNVGDYRVLVNKTPFFTEKGFKLKNGDNIIIRITPLDEDKPSNIRFVGYSPEEYYDDSVLTEFVNKQPITHEEINV